MEAITIIGKKWGGHRAGAGRPRGITKALDVTKAESMFFIDGRSYTEIAASLGVSVRTLRRRMRS